MTFDRASAIPPIPRRHRSAIRQAASARSSEGRVTGTSHGRLPGDSQFGRSRALKRLHLEHVHFRAGLFVNRGG